MASSKKLNTSHFASGHDRYLALQRVSSRILSRAGTLNNLEEMELGRRTKQLELEENIKRAELNAVKKRLCGTHTIRGSSGRGATARVGIRVSKSENDMKRPTFCNLSSSNGFGSDSGTRSIPSAHRTTARVNAHTRLADAMTDLDDRRGRRERLLRIAKKESEIVIDRKLTTDQILNADHLPLSQRLVITNTEKFQSVIARARAVNVVNKFRTKIKEKKEEEKGMKLQKSSRGQFSTRVTKTNISVPSDLLID